MKPFGQGCNVQSGSILLVGDAGRVFSDCGDVDELGCNIQGNMLDAIDVAASEKFGLIVVVMAGFSSGLNMALNPYSRYGCFCLNK